MPGTFADALLLSLGVAFSPIPILAVLALLLSERPRATGLGFTGGWLGGIVSVVSAATVLGLYTERLGLGRAATIRGGDRGRPRGRGGHGRGGGLAPSAPQGQ